VPVTRARELAVIYTDDKAGLLKAVMKTDKVVSATEVAARRARQKRRARMQETLDMHRRREAQLLPFTRRVDKALQPVREQEPKRKVVGYER
jgi:hypothetical protein